MHGDDGVDDFEGQMRFGALGRQQMSTGITDCFEDLPDAQFDQALNHITRSILAEAWEILLAGMHDYGVDLLMSLR